MQRVRITTRNLRRCVYLKDVGKNVIHLCVSSGIVHSALLSGMSMLGQLIHEMLAIS